jgi:hypothetical protein
MREFKDLTLDEQKAVKDIAVNREVKFRLDILSSDLEKEEITEEELWKKIGCSKHYGESTPWFVGRVYYEHHKEDVDKAAQENLDAAVFNSYGTQVCV